MMKIYLNIIQVKWIVSESQKIFNELINNYSYYWIFNKEGIQNKIIFKKHLSTYAGIFYQCYNINEINISKFNCPKILSCY